MFRKQGHNEFILGISQAICRCHCNIENKDLDGSRIIMRNSNMTEVRAAVKIETHRTQTTWHV